MKEQPTGQYKPAEKLKLPDLSLDVTKGFKKICCPSCNDNVPADNLNLQHHVAKCSACDVVFSIEDDLSKIKTKQEMKQEVIRPEGIDLFYYKGELEITIKQHLQGLDAFGIAIFPFAAIFSIFIYFEKEILILFPILLSLIGIYFIFRAFNSSKNKAYIDINDKFLTIKNRPKNLKKDRAYDVRDIDQLYLRNDGTGYIAMYMIVNGLEGQKHVKLLNLNTISKAKFLEQEIERYLKIEDRKVIESNVS